jgi:hypothetical protein
MNQQPRDPKTLTGRLEVDYFERPRGLRRAKWLASVVAFGLTGIVAVAAIAFPSSHALFQAGPVSSPHAHFGARCADCHDQPFAAVQRLIPGRQSFSVSDARCLSCHPAGAHHPDAAAHAGPGGQAANCVTCHHEHRGGSLTRLADASCVVCHADLRTESGAGRFASAIRHFADGHPEFGAWRGGPLVDPAGDNLMFNHERHLALASQAGEFSGDRRPALAAELTKLRILDCSYCHQPGPDGRQMLPIRFESHCAACHPLTVAVQPPGAWPTSFAESFTKKPLQHPSPDRGAEQVRNELLGRYLAAPVPSDPKALASVAAPPVLRLPGESAARFGERLAGQLARQTESQLFDRAGVGCRLCHVEVAREDGLPRFAKARQGFDRWSDDMPGWPDAARFQSTAYRDASRRWFPRAMFDHRSHRTQQCTECHDARTSRKTSDLLIPKWASCVTCHHDGPQATRSDCLTCHTYHDRSREGPDADPQTKPDRGRRQENHP